jgi:hypothetical protein
MVHVFAYDGQISLATTGCRPRGDSTFAKQYNIVPASLSYRQPETFVAMGWDGKRASENQPMGRWKNE